MTDTLLQLVNCPECGGSGYFAGTYGDIVCIDCNGEGQWEADPEESDTGITLDELRERYVLTEEVHGDPLLKAKRRAA